MNDLFLLPEPDVIRMEGVTRRFGDRTVLDDVSLTVQAGTVFGLVGRNGAGKTTLIRHVLGLLRPLAGSVRVFGRDPVRDPAGVLSEIGYLSEDVDLPGWMRVEELMRYSRSFYPTWDAGYAGQLREEFDLPGSAFIHSLSKGQRARAGLLITLAHRPNLLVLDEPSSGLDPVVRRDILAAIVRTIADEGRTVLFSSHLLEEVERVADRVAMLQNGRIVFCDALDELKERYWRVTLRFSAPRTEPPQLEEAIAWEGSGQDWTAVCAGRLEQIEAAGAVAGAELVQHHGLSLDEIFLARAGEGPL